MAGTNGVESHKPGLFTPLDKAHQEAFVGTVQDVARAGILLSFGVVLGVLFSWLAASRAKKG